MRQVDQTFAARGMAVLALSLCGFAGCGSEPEPKLDRGGEREQRERDAEDERPALCARDRDDTVRDVFCAASPPKIRGLRDLQEHLDLVPETQFYEEGGDPLGGDKFVTVLGHSTALSGHVISPINPRLLVLGRGTLMAFQRGVQKVEVIAFARNAGTLLNFYLIEFEQACNRRDAGCSSGDLYTQRIERDWLSVAIRDDEELKNTPSDCRQCHQRALETPRFLMRELNNPWTHFLQPPPGNGQFVGPGVQGQDLLEDYMRAKGDELYGGFAMNKLVPLAPFLLESMVGPDQPVLFDAPGIENERWPYSRENGYPQEPGPSQTWEAAFEAFKRGEQLALPYLEPRPTDPDKHARLSDAYARYRAGELSADELPDMDDIFPDDPQVRAQIGLQTEPEASAEDALIQACGSCHNDVLDQEISRARFNIDLWRHDPGAIEIAIERLERSPGEPGVMPPPEARQLDPQARQKLLDYLRDDPRSKQPDPRLERAAELGMAGGSNRRSIDRR